MLDDNDDRPIMTATEVSRSRLRSELLWSQRPHLTHLGLVLLVKRAGASANGGRSLEGGGLGVGLGALGSDLEVGAVELWVSDESG